MRDADVKRWQVLELSPCLGQRHRLKLQRHEAAVDRERRVSDEQPQVRQARLGLGRRDRRTRIARRLQ